MIFGYFLGNLSETKTLCTRYLRKQENKYLKVHHYDFETKFVMKNYLEIGVILWKNPK